MKILLSPAKSLDFTRNIETPTYSQASLLEDSEYLVNKLAKFTVKKFEKTMHISKELAELNFNRYQNWVSPTKPGENAKPAVTVFTGEVYRGLDIESFSKSELKRAQKEIRILSGLYGVLKAFDLMYPYRLEMGTKWAVTPKKSNLYKFWGDKVTELLNDELEKDELLVNLASNEYFKVVNTKKLQGQLVTPLFKDLKGDQYKTIMMYAKNARGAMAKQIIKNKVDSLDGLKAMNIDGYQYAESMSNQNELVFIR